MGHARRHRHLDLRPRHGRDHPAARAELASTCSRTAARHGVRAGYRAAAGVFLGDWVLMVAAALGVASLLQAYPPLFLVIKYAGAAYLAYVGITMAVGAIRRWRRAARVAAPPPLRRRRAGRCRPTVPAGAGDLAAQPEGDPVLHLLLHPVPRPDVRRTRRCRSCCSPRSCRCAASLYLSALIFGGTYLAGQFRRRRRLAAGLTAGVGALFVGFGIRLATASCRSRTGADG